MAECNDRKAGMAIADQGVDRGHVGDNLGRPAGFGERAGDGVGRAGDAVAAVVMRIGVIARPARNIAKRL
jgi:hypothetical protein